LGGQLFLRVKKRSAIIPGSLWIVVHCGAGALVFGLYWLLLLRDPGLFSWLPKGFGGQLIHIGLIVSVIGLAIFLLQKFIPVPECGCADDDETPPATVRRSSWDPFYTPPPVPWHGQTAMATIGGFLLGICFATPDNLVQAWPNPWLLFLRQLGPMVIYGSSGAIIAWGLYRAKLQRRRKLIAQSLLGAFSIGAVYFAINAMDFPWSLMSWFMVPTCLAMLWRYAGDSHPIRRPAKSKKSKDEKCD